MFFVTRHNVENQSFFKSVFIAIQCNTDYPTSQGTGEKMSDDPSCRIIRGKCITEIGRA